ncbi:MAG: hypothetical protein GY757_03890 [bacterium]|nr:hypothetical protein [bacterium]
MSFKKKLPPKMSDVGGNLEAPELVTVKPKIEKVQFNTNIPIELDKKIRHIAYRDGLKLYEVLQKAIEAYEK